MNLSGLGISLRVAETMTGRMARIEIEPLLIYPPHTAGRDVEDHHAVVFARPGYCKAIHKLLYSDAALWIDGS